MLCSANGVLRCIVKIAKLMEELGRQRDLKETYKARLESTQGYLRFCLEVAQERGFMHLISDSAQPQQHSPHRDADSETAPTAAGDDVDDEDEPAETPPPCDPYLAATRGLAVEHGWSVAPEEVRRSIKNSRQNMPPDRTAGARPVHLTSACSDRSRSRSSCTRW
jgi:hypothetical protein